MAATVKKRKSKKPNPNRRRIIIVAEVGEIKVTIKVSPWQAKMVELEDWEGARSVYIQALKKFEKEFPNYNWVFLNEENCTLKVAKKLPPPTPTMRKGEHVQLTFF